MSQANINAILEMAKQIAETSQKDFSSPVLTNLKHFFQELSTFGDHINLNAPAIISIVGGTGVGKSYLFSQLLGMKDISPSSSSVRSYTKDLFVSCFKEQQAYFPFKEKVVFCPGVLSNCILVDSPDLDTIISSNKELTKNLINFSDIIVYVTTPDKRSNFDIQMELLDWSERKKWIFVLNKIDTAMDVGKEQLKNDFDCCLNKFGFSPSDSNRFLINSKDTNSFQFQKLKDVIFSARTKENILALKTYTFLSHIAFQLENSKALNRLLESRKVFKEEILKQLSARNTLQKEIAKDLKFQIHWKSFVEYEIWKNLKQARSLFLFPFVLLHSHFSEEISMAELNSKFLSFLNSSEKKKALDIDSKRIIEDYAIIFPKTTKESNLAQYSMQPIISNSLKELKVTFSTHFYLFLGNILPMIFFCQIVNRTFFNWLKGTWLPYDFFVHGFVLIILSCIPGYFLLTYLIKRQSDGIKISLIDENKVPDELSIVEQSLTDLTNSVSNFTMLVNSSKDDCL